MFGDRLHFYFLRYMLESCIVAGKMGVSIYEGLSVIHDSSYFTGIDYFFLELVLFQ